MSHPQPNPYPQQPSAPFQPALKSNHAVAALVCGLFSPIAWFGSHGLALTLALVAVVCAVLALRQINKGVGSGRGMAVWGLILGLMFSLAGLGSMTSNGPAATTATAATVSSSPAVQHTAPAQQPVQVAGPTATSIPGNGTFLVNDEITPGTYRSTGATPGIFEFCAWQRLHDTAGGNIIGFGTAKKAEPLIVTIVASDGAFKTSGCEPWLRIK